MSDEVWRRDEVQSPCIRICVIHPAAGICVGCHRTADEISRWSRMSDEARREVTEALPSRAPLLVDRRNRPSARRRARGVAPPDLG